MGRNTKASERGFAGIDVVMQLRDARRDREVDRSVIVKDRNRVDRGQDPRHDHVRIGGHCARHHDRDRAADVARDDVLGSSLHPRDLRDVREHRIAGGIAVALVDQPQAIDVDHGDAERLAATLRGCDLTR